MTPFSEFLKWEQSTKDTIDFKKAYVWMTATEDDPDGDVLAGLHLAQIVYWHLPAHDGKPKLRVVKNGKLWLVKRRGDWKNEICLSSRQVDRTTARLVQVGLIETAIYKFDGEPTTHIHLHQDVFLRLWRKAIGLDSQDPLAGGDPPKSPNGDKEITPPDAASEKSKLPIGENQSPNRGTPVTETPTETTTERDTASADASALSLSAGISQTVQEANAEFDALPSAAGQIRTRPVFTDDADGWYECLIKLAYDQPRTWFEQNKPESLRKRFHLRAKEFAQAKRQTSVAVDQYWKGSAGCYWWTVYWKGAEKKDWPKPEDIAETWGDWERVTPLAVEVKPEPVVYHAPEKPKINVISVAERLELARQYRQNKLPEVTYGTGD